MPTTEQFRQLAGATVRGTEGRVYLFPYSVRIPCGCPRSIDHRKNWVSPCSSGLGSKCPGWVPSEDGWVWGPAVRVAMVQSEMMESRWAERLGLAWTSGRDAFLAMLREAVLSIEGVEIG